MRDRKRKKGRSKEGGMGGRKGTERREEREGGRESIHYYTRKCYSVGRANVSST